MEDLGLLRGLITLLTLATFLGICWWAYRGDNRARFLGEIVGQALGASELVVELGEQVLDFL